MTTTPVTTGGTVPPKAASPAPKTTPAKAKGQRSQRHTPEQIVAKLRDADAMRDAGKDIAAVVDLPQKFATSERRACGVSRDPRSVTWCSCGMRMRWRSVSDYERWSVSDLASGIAV